MITKAQIKKRVADKNAPLMSRSEARQALARELRRYRERYFTETDSWARNYQRSAARNFVGDALVLRIIDFDPYKKLTDWVTSWQVNAPQAVHA